MRAHPWVWADPCSLDCVQASITDTTVLGVNVKQLQHLYMDKGFFAKTASETALALQMASELTDANPSAIGVYDLVEVIKHAAKMLNRVCRYHAIDHNNLVAEQDQKRRLGQT
jgi:hypothetical protein